MVISQQDAEAWQRRANRIARCTEEIATLQSERDRLLSEVQAELHP
jgi:hypothetical protein